MSYRALLHETRPTFLVLGFLARLPYAMAALGTLLLLQSATGSYGFAGAAAGLQNLAIAAGGVIAGRLTERLGLRRLGALTAVANAAALGGLIAATHLGRPAMLAAAVAVGLAQAQIGALTRTHWSQVAGSRAGLLASALSYEAAADEASFIVGPAAVGLLAAIATPVPVAAAAALLLVAALPLARRYAEPGRIHHATGRAALPVLRLAPLALAMAFIGAIFGVLQIGVTASASPGAAGLLYAELGLGSALAGLAYGWLPARFGFRARYRTFAGTLLAGMTVIALGGVLLPLPVAFVVAGATVAPYLISVYALAERASAGRVAVALTVVGAGGPVGTAVGQTVAGALVDGHGARAAFVLAAVLAGLAVLNSLVPARRPRSGDVRVAGAQCPPGPHPEPRGTVSCGQA